MKSKSEPVSKRTIKLLKILSSYTLNLYYLKGKDMVLTDFLSRMVGDKRDHYKVLSI